MGSQLRHSSSPRPENQGRTVPRRTGTSFTISVQEARKEAEVRQEDRGRACQMDPDPGITLLPDLAEERDRESKRDRVQSVRFGLFSRDVRVVA